MSNLYNNKTPFCQTLSVILEKIFDGSATINDVCVNEFLAMGENFASKLFQVLIKTQKHTNLQIQDHNLVCKTLSANLTYLDWHILFEKEIFMYKKISPFYGSFDKKTSVEVKYLIHECLPKLYGYHLSSENSVTEQVDGENMLLLEDLQTQGYHLVDKKIGLDLNHATVAIQILAKFHALGIITKIKHPEVFGEFKAQALRSGFPENLDNSNLVKTIKTHPIFSKYGDRAQELAGRLKNGRSIEIAREGLWCTIVHYDFWTNNFMFRSSNDGSIEGFKFFDFQSYTYADLFIDLTYFLCTSLDDDTMLNNFDTLIDIYYDTFVEILDENDVDLAQFSRASFDDQLRKDAALEFLHCDYGLLFFTYEMKDNIQDQRELIDKIFECEGNDLYFRKLQNLFDVYLRKGWFYDEEKK